MINLSSLRENPELITQNILKKDPTFPVAELIKLDENLRLKLIEVEDLRFKRNEKAKSIKGPISAEERAEAGKITEILKEKEEVLDKLKIEFNNLYLTCPNLLEDDVPKGNKEANLVVKIVGQKPEFNFQLKNHLELNKLNNWFDLEAASSEIL